MKHFFQKTLALMSFITVMLSIPVFNSPSSAAEDDDDISGVALNATNIGYLDENTDTDDIYYVDLAVGEEVRFTLTGDAGTIFLLRLYEPDTTTIINNGRWIIGTGSSEYTNAVINYKATETGRYFVNVTTNVWDAGSGNYQLTYLNLGESGVPTGFTLRGVSCTMVDLSWNLVAGAIGYNIYSSSDKLNTTLITDSSYKVTDLTKTTGYCFTIKAVFASGESEPSIPIYTWTLAQDDDDIPGIPLGAENNGALDTIADREDVYFIDLVAGDDVRFKLTCDSNTDFELYLYGPSTTTVKGNNQYIEHSKHNGLIEEINYTATEPGRYFIKVYTYPYAYSGSGNYNLTYLKLNDEVIPTGFTSPSKTGISVDLSWNPVVGAIGYSVYDGLVKAADTTKNKCTVAVLTKGKTYCFTVKAYFSSGESMSSDSLFITTLTKEDDDDIPGIALNTVNKGYLSSTRDNVDVYSIHLNAGDNVLFSLTDGSGTDVTYTSSNFNLYLYGQSTTSIDHKKAIKKSENYMINEKISFTTATTGKYYIEVHASAGANNYELSYLKIKPPVAPTGVKASPTSYNSVKLSWKAVAGSYGYTVYRSTSVNGTYASVGTTTTNSYTNSNLTTGTAYYFKVAAYINFDTKKIIGAQSSVASAKPVPATPTGVKASSVSYNSVKLTWTAISGASSYGIYRATSANGTYTKVTTVKSNSYTNTNLATGTTYYYKINAYRTVGSSYVYGSKASAVSAKPVPATVGSFKVARASSTSIKISWESVSGASGYEIYRSTSSSGTYSLVKSTTSKSFTNTGLSKGKTYYYKIRAYRTVGSKKVYGGYTTTKYTKL